MQINTAVLSTVLKIIVFGLFALLSGILLITNLFEFTNFYPSHKKSNTAHKGFVCSDVSATLTSLNEEYTIEQSIESIAPYVGEVVVVEHGSTDSTPKILQKLSQKYPNIIVKNGGSLLPYSESNNLGYMLSSKPWILPWAADYFLYPNAAKKICSLIEYCEKQNIQIVNYSIPRIDGDINHVYSSKVNGEVIEERLFKRGAVITRQTAKYVDSKIVPLTKIRSTTSDQFFQIHAASFKNAERLYYSNHMKEYLIYHNFEVAKVKKPMPFWEWEYCRLHDTNTTGKADIQAFKKQRMEKFCKELILPYSSFDHKKWGPIPSYLKKLPFFKKFGIKYIKDDENGNKLYRPTIPGC